MYCLLIKRIKVLLTGINQGKATEKRCESFFVNEIKNAIPLLLNEKSDFSRMPKPDFQYIASNS